VDAFFRHCPVSPANSSISAHISASFDPTFGQCTVPHTNSSLNNITGAALVAAFFRHCTVSPANSSIDAKISAPEDLTMYAHHFFCNPLVSPPLPSSLYGIARRRVIPLVDDMFPTAQFSVGKPECRCCRRTRIDGLPPSRTCRRLKALKPPRRGGAEGARTCT
jgi:hypothetical protein